MKEAVLIIYGIVLAVFIFGWGAVSYHLYRYGFKNHQRLINWIVGLFAFISLGLIGWVSFLLFSLI